MADVLLVTTWDKPCGIAEHSAMLKEAVCDADSGIQIEPVDALAPETCPETAPIIHLNYHAALHSLWTPDWVRYYQKLGKKVVITYHDTGVPNSDQCKALYAVADAFIIHEPADDLPGAHYWRMGVPDWAGAYQLGWSNFGPRQYRDQPVLGTVGFPFPWKCYDQLAEVTAKVGWALLLIAPGATDEQIAEWKSINPYLDVRRDFTPRGEVLSLLGGCDATAFTYVTHNTGQSAAILSGIGARKPVIALSTCRQMRALFEDPLGRTAISWVDTFEAMAFVLSHFTPIQRISPPIVALAEQESWRHRGKQYAELYRGLL